MVLGKSNRVMRQLSKDEGRNVLSTAVDESMVGHAINVRTWSPRITFHRCDELMPIQKGGSGSPAWIRVTDPRRIKLTPRRCWLGGGVVGFHSLALSGAVVFHSLALSQSNFSLSVGPKLLQLDRKLLHVEVPGQCVRVRDMAADGRSSEDDG